MKFFVYFKCSTTNEKYSLAILKKLPNSKNKRVLSYYNTNMGWGVQMFKWGYFSKKLNPKLLHQIEILQGI